MVNHINGKCDVRDELMQKYLFRVKAEVGKFEYFKIQQVSRESNQLVGMLSQSGYPGGGPAQEHTTLVIAEPEVMEIEEASFLVRSVHCLPKV